MREAWVRLCGTYLSKGGVLANPEVRKVKFYDVMNQALFS
jgi:hypothetical protein